MNKKELRKLLKGMCPLMRKINPPPVDLHCERCGKAFEDLPDFPAGLYYKYPELRAYYVTSMKDGKMIVKLYKMFWEDCGCVSASWECYDCARTPDDSKKNKPDSNIELLEDSPRK